ncbi:hypothetical protein HPB51_011175 [Rhipicephalus microplus]|uniref:Fibrinogen C-terminal domain-containing protein n=1 Tax=Rhipicephalus microplus TaxID=6941 RepID=A0A9J6F1T7_RHIMP|nr:hypothetical protein HPB51_011175 [Rhipicephalus microplus]
MANAEPSASTSASPTKTASQPYVFTPLKDPGTFCGTDGIDVGDCLAMFERSAVASECQNCSRLFYTKLKPHHVISESIRPRNCADQLHSGQTTNGLYNVFLRADDITGKVVYCDMETDGGGWTVIQRRGQFGNGAYYFYRNWTEYAEGFGDPSKEYWIGNKALHALTEEGEGMELRILLRNHTGDGVAIEYDSFQVASEEEHFKLQLGDLLGPAGSSDFLAHYNLLPNGRHDHLIEATSGHSTPGQRLAAHQPSIEVPRGQPQWPQHERLARELRRWHRVESTRHARSPVPLLSPLQRSPCIQQLLVVHPSSRQRNTYENSVISWTTLKTIQRRGQFGNSVYHFYRNWTEYANGFGDPSEEHWIGNNALHALTSDDAEMSLRILLKNNTADSASVEYESVSVANEDNLYKLQVGKFLGPEGWDAMVHANGQNFSTYDRDNDSGAANCAVLYRGGWWYSQCHAANLNGLNLNGPHDSYADGIEWSVRNGPARLYHYSYPVVEMMIRPAGSTLDRRSLPPLS